MREKQQEVLQSVELLLEQHNYPLGDLEVEPFGDEDVEINAKLLTTSVDSTELDHIASYLIGNEAIQ